MANISFEKEMRLSKRETEELFWLLESESKVKYKVKTPEAKKATKEMAEKLFDRKG